MTKTKTRTIHTNVLSRAQCTCTVVVQDRPEKINYKIVESGILKMKPRSKVSEASKAKIWFSFGTQRRCTWMIADKLPWTGMGRGKHGSDSKKANRGRGDQPYQDGGIVGGGE